LPSFAKVKEKQRHPQVNASCFTSAFALPHIDSSSIDSIIKYLNS
jgi:hypothetical protein